MGKGDLGVRVMQKNATDLIDDTQVGVTDLHQDINYSLGRIATQTAYYQLPLARAEPLLSLGQPHVLGQQGLRNTAAWRRASVRPAIGRRRITTSASTSRRGSSPTIASGGWIAVDGEYGSGLSSAQNPTGGITCAGLNEAVDIGGPCKRTPHLTFDVQKGIAMGPGVALTLKMQNIFNDLYEVTYLERARATTTPRRARSRSGLRFNTK